MDTLLELKCPSGETEGNDFLKRRIVQLFLDVGVALEMGLWKHK